MNLAELQRAFQSRVLYGATQIDAAIASTPRLNAATRLGIYEEAYLARLIEALAETYPALRNAVGEEEFSGLTRRFAAKTPPSHFSIRCFGSDIAAFIAAELAGVKGKVLSELARWEWALSESFLAADTVALTREDLAGIEPARWGFARFRLAPSVQRMRLSSNAVQWWRATSDRSRRPTRWRMSKPFEWAIWRSQLTTYFRSMPEDESRALEVIANGRSFSAMCEELASFHGEATASTRAATLLLRWVSDGWIAGVE